MADSTSVHQTRFEAAVKVIQSLPKNGSITCQMARLGQHSVYYSHSDIVPATDLVSAEAEMLISY